MPGVSRTDLESILRDQESRISALERAGNGLPSADTADVLTYVGGRWVPRRTTPISWEQNFLVAATLTPHIIFANTVPADWMGAQGAISVEINGVYHSGIPLGGFPQSFTPEIEFGGTTLWKATTPLMTSVANDRAWRLSATLVNEDHNSQLLAGVMSVSDDTAPAAGLGDLQPDALPPTTFGGTAAVETAGFDQDLVVKLTFLTLVQEAHGSVRAVLFPAPIT